MAEDYKTTETETLQEMVRVMMAHHFSLRVAVTALLRTHPDAEEALKYFDHVSESLRATLLHSNWSEARIDEFERNLAGLRRDLSHDPVSRSTNKG
ncbi:MAG: hypothetical protein EKK46_11260 [Rhodocyclaceae bacterium]|nr:MAG: hypothetical protein EKK46_11260 [Rhodocyclaceae bacterium]